LQQDYRRTLEALAVLIALALLIACANVANLLTAQAAARSREMALRVSIGAGRWRLIQLVLVESAWLALLSAAAGAFFAWWSAPFVVSRINPPDNPARVALPADWRVLAFGVALTLFVTVLFGLAPALRASSVRPASALKGGDDPHSRRRLMHALVASQVAFCFLVIFIAGLFAASFHRLSHRPIGFSTEGLLALDTLTRRPQPAEYWDQLAEHLRELPGVEKVAIAGWALPGGNSWNNFISINGAPPGPVLTYLLPVSPEWFDVMNMHLVAGRNFRISDVAPGSAIVNQTFVKEFLGNQKAVGSFFSSGPRRFEIVGVAIDAPYRDIHEAMLPVAFLPFHALTNDGTLQPSRQETFIVRAKAANPLALASFLRHEISAFRPDFRVSNIRTQQEIVEAQTVRDRLLAMLALFFAAVALLLAAVGLYGVLDYSVLERRREIGIRRAVGARSANIAGIVTVDLFAMIVAGAAAGLALGIGSVRYLEALLYQVNATEWQLLAIPAITIFTAALVAALPAVARALRIEPAKMLRAE
jgi:predicted permease